MSARHLALLLAFAGVPAAAQDREFSTDRPDKTESPFTVPDRRVQIELDFATYTRDRDADERTRTLNLLPFNLKLGVGPDTDVQLVAGAYVREIVDDRITGLRHTAEGVGDVTLRLKHNLWGNDGGKTAFALMPFITLPTGTGGVGNAYVEAGLIAPFAVELSDTFTLGAMTEVDLTRAENHDAYTATFINSATLGIDLTEKLGLYTELYTERSAEHDARFVATFDTGLTFAIGEDAQLDVGTNIGITDAADDLTLFAGFSRRF